MEKEKVTFANGFKSIVDSAIVEARSQLLFDKLNYRIRIKTSSVLLKWYWRLKLKKASKKQKLFEEGIKEYNKACEAIEADTRSLNDPVKPMSEKTMKEIIKMIKDDENAN